MKICFDHNDIVTLDPGDYLDNDTEGWIPNLRIDDLRVKDDVMIATIAANMSNPIISVVAEKYWDDIALLERGR